MAVPLRPGDAPGMPQRRTVHRVCPFCEATCGLAVEVEGDSIVSRARRQGRPVLARLHLPEGVRAEGALPRPGSAAPAGAAHARTAGRRSAGRRPTTRSRRACSRSASKHGNDAIGMYTGNPVVHDLGALLYRPVLQRALASRSMFNASAIDTLPKIVQTGLMFGRQFPTAVPVPDIDRTRLPADHRREPDDLARQPDDDARRARPPEGGASSAAASSSSSIRAAPRRRRSPASTTSSGPAPTRPSCSRWSTRCSTRTSSSSAPPTGWSAASTRSRPWRASSRPRSVADYCGIAGRRDPAHRARARGGEVGGLLRPPRHLRAGVRHARELGLRPRQHPDRQPRPPGRRDVHDAGGADRRGAAEGQGLRDRALEEPRRAASPRSRG